jgi:ArsR family transcriptional regulator, arsenate/arsenite/antimonite-responsive transcriptional repressor
MKGALVKSPQSQAVGAPCCPSVLDAPLPEHEAVDLAAVFAALGDPVRLRLLSLVASSDEVCSCNLEGPLGRSQPTISHHTKILAAVGLIKGEKRGRWVWWRAVPERVDAIRGALERRPPARKTSAAAASEDAS